jgi:flavin-dependent dehydrogenase
MYDVIIIGARVAGSPLAMLLAKAGHRVLVVDRATFPSDIMSTHYIQQDGVKRLQEWGLYDRVMASNCPPIPKITFHLNGVAMPTPPQPEGMPDAICPRRYVLDAILVEAAGAAGAEVREGFSVQEILMEGDRVAGIKGRGADGAVVEERAAVTVGADGQHSVVARAVKAAEYDAHPAYTCGYYSYFSGVPLDGAEAYVGGEAGVLAFPTNDDLTCIGAGTEHGRFHEYRSDIEGMFDRLIEAASPSFAARVRAGKRVEKWIGTAETHNFFREPYGPGWALCGDAGYHKDFVTGLGIADAFRDAEFLSEALHAGLSGARTMEDALAAYQKRRDEAAKPMYDITVSLVSGSFAEGFANNAVDQMREARAGS